MKKVLQLLAVSLLLAYSATSFASTSAERHKARPKGTTSLQFGYYEYLPSNYATAAQLPVVIFFHGIGEKGNGTTELSRVLRNGPPKLVNAGKDFPFILISVQHPSGWWNGADATTLINFVKGKYKVDPYRVYVTGLSAGGSGTWTAGTAVSTQVAAIVPVCGCGQTQYASNLVKIPVWAFHNSGDPVVNQACSINMVNAIKAAGGSPKLTIYQSKAHDAWTATYNSTEMWNWLLSQRKGAVTSNIAPVANAGSDKSLLLPANATTLTGTSSDQDGTIATKKWTKVSGPAATMADVTTSYLKLTNLVAGTYVFRFTVTDNKAASDYDDVKVTVTSSTSTITVSAGPDRYLTLPTNTITLVGSSSTTSGTIATRTWTKISGPSATMTYAYTSYLHLSNLVAGTYVFRFTVKNSANAVKYDDVKLIVRSSTARMALGEATSSEISAFPNPAKEKFTLVLDKVEDSNVQVKVISGTDGRVVFDQEIGTSWNSRPQIDISNFESGIYLVKVISSTGDKTLRIIKQ